ncbi:MAG: putative dithiol-disulfide oxidoreductase, family [Schlesneria sp.]|nr:putative dithiol-disulfide oxidoreductase, family [Schlesneria sp.]
MDSTTPHPPIVSREEWLGKRKELLAAEKELTKHLDHVNAQRRRLPMVELDKPYEFAGPNGKVSLLDLFDGKRQLIVYHFMFDPDWEKGCPGCTGLVNGMGDLSQLQERNTNLVLISRAPFPKLQKYKQEQGWNRPWVSSYGSRFNYDFNVTLDNSIVSLQYNYRPKEELEARKETEPYFTQGESHGLSVFFRLDDRVYHTYSTYARGCEGLTDLYSLLDRTPYGRQEDFEDSPTGWPQKPTYGG